jgi:hypothetical protein
MAAGLPSRFHSARGPSHVVGAVLPRAELPLSRGVLGGQVAGRGRASTLWRVVLPHLATALLTVVLVLHEHLTRSLANLTKQGIGELIALVIRRAIGGRTVPLARGRRDEDRHVDARRRADPGAGRGLWASLRSRPAELDNPAGWGYPLRPRRRGSHDVMRARIRRSGCGLATDSLMRRTTVPIAQAARRGSSGVPGEKPGEGLAVAGRVGVDGRDVVGAGDAKVGDQVGPCAGESVGEGGRDDGVGGSLDQ